MLIGVPKEIKVHEYRVGLTPESVKDLATRGHRVLVEKDAGAGIGAGDADYESAGAVVASTAQEIFAQAELIVKVKEPLASERARLRPDQAIFTYLHLAADPAQARDLVQSGAIAIAYETVTSLAGGLPLLAPMSEVAGRMAVQVAAHYLERPHGGRGLLISGAAGVPPAVHYCVANMPGAVPHTSTYALNYATLPFVTELANRGVVEALKANEHLRNGLTVCRGAVTRREVGEALGYAYVEPLRALGA